MGDTAGTRRVASIINSKKMLTLLAVASEVDGYDVGWHGDEEHQSLH